jgi:uncharacterized protein with ParB-like and HNH nuclease domain
MKTIQEIFNNTIFRIPDYQRGYSWKERQLNDFWQDITNLQSNKLHYTGHITLNDAPLEKIKKWTDDIWILEQQNYKPFYVVDGQQRLTTIILLINAIVNSISDKDKICNLSKQQIIEKYLYKKNGKGTLQAFIFGYEIDDPSDVYYKKDILKCITTKTEQPKTTYTNNLEFANKYFRNKLLELELADIETIFYKLSNQLVFDIEPLGKGLDIFVVFETLNNRGKPLTHLEKLKNRLIYLTTLIPKITQTELVSLRNDINSTWKNIYEYLGKNRKNTLDDDEFLRTHFILFNTFQKEKGFPYDNIFDQIFTVTNTIKHKPSVNQKTIKQYIQSLRFAIVKWFIIRNPDMALQNELISNDECVWLSRINRLKVSIFYPLILAVYMKEENDKTRVKFLNKIESFCFLNYYCAGKRSSYGNTEFPSMASKYFKNEVDINFVIDEIQNWTFGDVGAFSVEQFIFNMSDQMKSSKRNGYYDWNGIRYLLFEYEEMLRKRSKESPRVEFESHNSIEHIYPQTDTDPSWKIDFGRFTPNQKKYLRNSLGNLVLLKGSKNSMLSNSSYVDKRHKVSKSGFSQEGYIIGSFSEVELATNYSKWRPKDIYSRGVRILKFLCANWGIEMTQKQMKTLLFIDSKLIAKIR